MTQDSSTSSWAAYLPPTLQLPQFYFSLLALFAVVGLVKSALPGPISKYPWILQVIVLTSAIGLLVLIMGPTVYAVGTAVIGSWGTTSLYDTFYNLGFKFLEGKLQAFFGTTVASVPVATVDQSMLSKFPSKPTTPTDSIDK